MSGKATLAAIACGLTVSSYAHGLWWVYSHGDQAAFALAACVISGMFALGAWAGVFT